MKLTIEIPDATLRHAVETQVSAALATMTRESVEAQAKEVVNTSLSRIDFWSVVRQQADAALAPHVEKAINEVLGRDYFARRNAVAKLIQDAALEAIKKGSK